ncbi:MULTISPECIES: FAD binding domain-containing protein [unclassified Aureimonas]|uniref:FAD binding domain-containing protein n=1 Tax=unclassified Aureimonas TaxID=2615206 RepID=UPI0006F6182C|nr:MULTISPECIES: FAD binding domain-containing protein [unclassified Aureimonas]KQT52507.1 FAD-binding molybdopterin dehydrogenase [Aureimonas sp. Leaf427]KQT77592.1 FAD-binding molybdopterin dehydrogenase [Aureimonas sp. Leaf460]
MPDVYVARTLASSLDALSERGKAGAPLAGGTWIMRAPLRGEAFKTSYVALSKIAALKVIEVGDRSVEIGAGATHAALADALSGLSGLEALAEAAGASANPAVRGMATLGGNLSTCDFAAADLVPALLALDAEVELAGAGGVDRMGIEAFLELRSQLEPGRLLTKVVLPRRPQRSAHVRLPLRKAGDYPVAVVSLAVTLDAASRVATARIAVGSVEPVARRWRGLEAALIGRSLDPDAVAVLAKAHLADLTGRDDGVEAPGWYRVAVLPALVRRAAAALLATS